MTTKDDFAERSKFLELEYEISHGLYPKFRKLQIILAGLEKITKENEKKSVIKEVVKIYAESEEKQMQHIEAREAILELYTKYFNKKPLKKYLQDLVLKSGCVEKIIKTTAEEILKKMREKKICDIRRSNEFLYFVQLQQSTPQFKIKELLATLFPLYVHLFDGFTQHAIYGFQKITKYMEPLTVLMNAVCKLILTAFVKDTSYKEEIKTKYVRPLLMSSYVLLFNEKISWDLRTKVGLIFIHSFDLSEVENINSLSQLDHGNCLPLEISSHGKYKTLIDAIEKNYKSNENVIIIYSSILNILPEQRLFNELVNGKYLICVLFEGIMDMARRRTAQPVIIVEISRTIHLMGKHLSRVPVDLIKPMFLVGLSYVFSHIEHFIDTVRTYTKLFFEDLVRVAAHHRSNGYTYLSAVLLREIKLLEGKSKLRFLAYDNIAKYIGCDYLLENFKNLPFTLLSFIDDVTINEQVCKTYINVLEKSFPAIQYEDEEESERVRNIWTVTWISPIISLIKTNKNSLPFCQRIFASAFQLQPTLLRIVFPNDYIGTTDEFKLILNCLHKARKLGIELLVAGEDSNLYWRGLIDVQKMDMFMIHQDEEVKLLVLAAVVDSLKTTEQFTDYEFVYLLTYIRYNISAQLSGTRKEIVTYYKKALARYNASYKALVRNIANCTNHMTVNGATQELQSELAAYNDMQKSHKRFIIHLTNCLVSNLSYDSNYPRRASSLELLLVLHGIVTTEEWLACWSEDDVKNSHNILFDTYESNKRMIVALLKTLPPSYLGFTSVDFTFKYLQRSLELAFDIKPSKTLSAAYLFEICCFSSYFFNVIQSSTDGREEPDRTLHMIEILTRKFMDRCEEVDLDDIPQSSFYGLVLGVRHLLESRDMSKNNDKYAPIFERLANTCILISKQIMPIVCNPSPEGYLPENEDISVTDESSVAQMMQVFAWRSIKEMTLLLAELVKQSITLEDSLEMLKEELLGQIGDYFLIIFLESKHRGVFEQAYIGFSTLCEYFGRSSNLQLSSLPEYWLKRALLLCIGDAGEEHLTATRRSAGLPFLIISILSCQHSNENSLFHRAMDTLLAGAQNTDVEYADFRIHCMNVLRAIYRHSKLGELVAPYVSDGVILAIGSFSSELWGIRNSATLLFATLITRIFGVQRTQDWEDLSIKNRLTIRVFYLRYPELFRFLLSTLSEECGRGNSQLLHPILMILARLYPSHMEEDNREMIEYLPYINVCLRHPVHRTRELAAKASVPLIDLTSVKAFFDTAFLKISEELCSDIECHGILLQVLHIFKNYSRNSNVRLPVNEYIRKSLHLMLLSGSKYSYVTADLWMEVTLQFLFTYRDLDDYQTFKDILKTMSFQMSADLLPVRAQGTFYKNRLILFLFVVLNKLEETDLTYTTVINQIMFYMNSKLRELKGMKNYCVYLMIALHQTWKAAIDKDFLQHALFLTGDFEIPSEIKTLVNSFDKLTIQKLLKNIHPYASAFVRKEINRMDILNKDYAALMFLLADFYPCTVSIIKQGRQKNLNHFIKFCDCDNEELISAVISVISTCLETVDLKQTRYHKLVEVLSNSASPAAAEHRRLAVSHFLVKNHILYCNEEPMLLGEDLCRIMSTVMVLLEDEEALIRNTMSRYQNALNVRIRINNSDRQEISGYKWPVVPEKAKEDLLYLATVLLPMDSAVNFIFSWACRYFPDPSVDTFEIFISRQYPDEKPVFEIFERGDLNVYAENTSLVDLCSRVLIKLLWSLPVPPNDDGTPIHLKDQTLNVAKVLFGALYNASETPMMLSKTKSTVIHVFESLIKYLRSYEDSSNGNFVNGFRMYLNETILSFLTTNLEHGDLFSVKKIIKKLFDPVFRQTRDR